MTIFPPAKPCCLGGEMVNLSVCVRACVRVFKKPLLRLTIHTLPPYGTMPQLQLLTMTIDR